MTTEQKAPASAPDGKRGFWDLIVALPWHKLNGSSVLIVGLSVVVLYFLLQFYRTSLDHDVSGGFPQPWHIFVIFLLVAAPVTFVTLGLRVPKTSSKNGKATKKRATK